MKWILIIIIGVLVIGYCISMLIEKMHNEGSNIKKYLREKEEKSAKEKKIKELEKELAELRRSN